MHELGHALAARHYGVESAVELHALGGLTRMSGRPLTRSEGFWVTLCGPAAGFGLWVVAYAVDRWIYPSADLFELLIGRMNPRLAAAAAVNFLLFINLWWTVFNLLPILPLDGGQMLRSILGPGRLRITQVVGVIFAAALATWAAIRGNWYNAAFLGYLAYMNLQGDPRALPGGTTRAGGPNP